MINNADFWASVNLIIEEGFTPEGLQKLDCYAEQFISRELVYERFSPYEQHGCATGGTTHVIATLLTGAEVEADTFASGVSDFKRICQRGKKQAERIELWAKAVGIWIDDIASSLSDILGERIAEGGEATVYDHGATLIKSIGLDYFIEPILALDRISLHNAFFPETRLTVLGFGRDTNGNFKIIVEQPFIKGTRMTEEEISEYMQRMGFKLYNARNWTYATPDIYLSDMHDENVIRSQEGNIFVIDCDIRINTPDLKCGGKRQLTTKVNFSQNKH